MKLPILAVFLVITLVLPANAYTGGDDGVLLFNGVYDDWVQITNPYVTFDMGSPVPIWSVGVHERTGGGLVHDLGMLFSNEGYYGFASVSNVMDNSQVSHPSTLWAVATFKPIIARYCRVYVNSTGTYIQSDELMINGFDGAGNPVPEPPSLLAVGGGLIGLIGIGRRAAERRQSNASST